MKCNIFELKSDNSICRQTEIKDENIDNAWNWRHVKINEIETRKDRQKNRKKD